MDASPSPARQDRRTAKPPTLLIIIAVVVGSLFLGCCSCTALGALLGGPSTDETPTSSRTPGVGPSASPTADTTTAAPGSEEATEEAESGVTYAVVARVVDGDTIELEDGTRVRYIGMDTPESGEPGGSEASARNRTLVEGKSVKLVRDVSETDKYGRLLRYVFVGGLFVNERLVSEGLATILTIPPDVAHSEDFLAAQKAARVAERGIWTPPPAPKPKPKPEPEPTTSGVTVYVTNTGEKYHVGSCRYLSKSKIPISLSDAQAGYEPCSVCDPPQ